ncbi:MAG: helix-turn-helix domain-containing protein [Limnoraphis sp. WC205]|nr:helix-turn-helix domain-containing protein [Limnoraphis sp. WC205]
MEAYQLSLFPNEPPVPVESLKKKRTPKKMETKPIEMIRTTEQAANILGVSKSTLYNASRAGNPYKIGDWSAEYLDRNSWKVTYSTTQ